MGLSSPAGDATNATGASPNCQLFGWKCPIDAQMAKGRSSAIRRPRGKSFCPRHGANFDLRTGEALTLPAFTPVETFPVLVENGVVKVELPEF